MKKAGRWLFQAWSAPSRRSERGRRPADFDCLEKREVLSTSTIVPFATQTGKVDPTTGQAVVHFLIESTRLSSTSSHPVLVGFLAEAPAGSTSRPQISDVVGPLGLKSNPTPKMRGSVIVPVPTATRAANDYTVHLLGLQNKGSDFVVDAFLAGDTNNDGVVDQTDLNRIRAAYGSVQGDGRYDPNADLNSDGHVGCKDRALARSNLGARVTTAPAAPQAVPAPSPVVTPTAPVQTVVLPIATAPTIALTPVQVQPVVQPQPTVQVQPTSANVVMIQPVATTPQYALVPITSQPGATPVYYSTQPGTTPSGPNQAIPTVTFAPYTSQSPATPYLPIQPTSPGYSYGQASPYSQYPTVTGSPQPIYVYPYSGPSNAAIPVVAR